MLPVLGSVLVIIAAILWIIELATGGSPSPARRFLTPIAGILVCIALVLLGIKVLV